MSKEKEQKEQKQPYETKITEEELKKLGFVQGSNKTGKISVASINEPKQSRDISSLEIVAKKRGFKVTHGTEKVGKISVMSYNVIKK